MTKSYIMTVAQEGVQLYGGRLEDKGSFTVFEDFSKKTVEEFCAIDTPMSEKQETHLGVVFSSAFSYTERENILGLLAQNGYVHIKEFDFNGYLCTLTKGFPYALILSADGDNLYVDYYDTARKSHVASTQIDGAGKDPRVEVLAECIWKKLIFEASYLNKAKDFEDVKKAAKDFLHSQKAELEGTIYLEGENHDFFIRRRDANIENVLDHGCTGVLSHLRNFANTQQINKNETVLVLSHGLAGNNYFHDVFNGFTTDIFEIDDMALHTILNVMMNDLQGITIDTTPIGLSHLPVNYIHEERTERSISFDIKFPEGAYAIEVSRDGTPIRTITDPQFIDDGLQPGHTYLYGFAVIYKNEFGEETKSQKTTKEISTLKLQLPTPVSLNIKQTDQEAILAWNQPERGIVRIYHSTKPFNLHSNDTIADVQALDYPMLSTLDTSYVVQKDFCGERYFIPITVIDNLGVAGEQQSITSMITPKGVRVDSTDISHVKVIWLWEGIPMVRVKWVAEDGNEHWEDIAHDGHLPELELPLTSKNRNITVKVSAIHQKPDGTLMESETVTQTVALASVKVNFNNAKSEAKLFSHKNEYSVTLQADGEPPCDLYVLLEEGCMPLDLTNFKSHLTISHQDLADGQEKKFTLKYERMQKKQPLYFRIIAADRSLPLRVVPETQKIK